MGIAYHRIRIATSRHNDKVEWWHRIDKQCFYMPMCMYSLANGCEQLAVYIESVTQPHHDMSWHEVTQPAD